MFTLVYSTLKLVCFSFVTYRSLSILLSKRYTLGTAVQDRLTQLVSQHINTCELTVFDETQFSIKCTQLQFIFIGCSTAIVFDGVNCISAGSVISVNVVCDIDIFIITIGSIDGVVVFTFLEFFLYNHIYCIQALLLYCDYIFNGSALFSYMLVGTCGLHDLIRATALLGGSGIINQLCSNILDLTFFVVTLDGVLVQHLIATTANVVFCITSSIPELTGALNSCVLYELNVSDTSVVYNTHTLYSSNILFTQGTVFSYDTDILLNRWEMYQSVINVLNFGTQVYNFWTYDISLSYMRTPIARSMYIADIRLSVSYFFRDAGRFSEIYQLYGYLFTDTALFLETTGIDAPFLCSENHGSYVFYNNTFNSAVLFMISGFLSLYSTMLNLFTMYRFSTVYIGCVLYQYTNMLLLSSTFIYWYLINMQYFHNCKMILTVATKVDIANTLYEQRIVKQLDFISRGRDTIIEYTHTEAAV